MTASYLQTPNIFGYFLFVTASNQIAPAADRLGMNQSCRVLQGSSLPNGLAGLEPAVERLFLHGRLGAVPRVAVVGTRRPSADALSFTSQLGQELAAAGVTVVSGGAEGVDIAAHEGAQQAVGGRTLVVAPCSWKRPFPAQHRSRFEEIVGRGGGFVTEHVGDVVARRHAFFRRNGVLVGLSDLVVMVEAPVRSGARNAAAWARRLGRPLLVVPHAPWQLRGGGNLVELRRGARLCEGSASVLKVLSELGRCYVEAGDGPQQGSLFGAAEIQTKAGRAQDCEGGLRQRMSDEVDFEVGAGRASSDSEQLLEALRGGSRHQEELALQLRLTPSALALLLLASSGRGEIRWCPGGMVSLCESRGAEDECDSTV